MNNSNQLQELFGRKSSSNNNVIKSKSPLSVNTAVLKESQQNYINDIINNNVVSPSSASPFVRRTILSNARQSWIFNKPPSIPEAESVYVQPTAILEKNLGTAKSRLSVIIQGGSNQQQYGRVMTNSIYIKTEKDKEVVSSPEIYKTSGIENSIDDLPLPPQLPTTPLSSRPISNVSSSSTNQYYSEYDTLSDSYHSLSSSFASNSIITNSRDSMSDTISMFSNSPSILNDHHHKLNKQLYNNAPQSSTGIPHQRYSMPSSSSEFTSPNSSNQYIIDSQRRASMPILSNDTELESTTNIRASFYSNTSNESSSVQRATLRPSRLSSPANAQLAQRASRASMRMSLNNLMQKRFNIALEILTTERHYVDCLQLVQRLFLSPLNESLKSANPILTKKSINEIFANLSDLININIELLKRLEERIAILIDDKPIEDSEDKFWNPEDGCLGDIFLNMAPFFKMYSIYVKNFNSALSVIDVQLRDNPAFSAFLRDIIKTGQCKGLTLQAYLIMPVQRIPRYKLLLEDLLKKTVETHPDYLNLKKAYQVIENVATFVNETIRQHEMFITMLDIQKSLTGFDEVLLVPGRTFIKRGTVKKICRRNHQQREFFLFSDILIYATPSLMDDTYTFHRKFDLEDVTVLVVDTQNVNGFLIMSPQKSFTLYADTQKDKESWINAIRDAKEEYLSAKRTLKIDSEADRCMNCSEEFYTIFRRKHHCRVCGKVVCHACSTRKFVIPGSSEREDQSARACDPCFFTMFPDALRDEDIAPGIHVWNLVNNKSTISLVESPQKDDDIKDKDNMFNILENNRASVALFSINKSLRDAIEAKRCDYCRVDFTVFRWRNECLKCKKIVCNECLTKKSIDFSSLPQKFLDELSSQTIENRRFSIMTNVIKICDFCYLGIDPNRITVDEETDGGWTAKGQISPPSTPKPFKSETSYNVKANDDEIFKQSSFDDKTMKVNKVEGYFNQVVIEKEQ
ncbi:8393_t:CDS:10 [Funneliformis caledonium]|uniref:8393_t:CDS:1 n=1 Tax=Funneliformis caledonium TaxID=1117310 RepID=A0A9N9A3K9_9GLOM|nr:8393_t:CDS:10 [Funneliformis caledonium]